MDFTLEDIRNYKLQVTKNTKDEWIVQPYWPSDYEKVDGSFIKNKDETIIWQYRYDSSSDAFGERLGTFVNKKLHKALFRAVDNVNEFIKYRTLAAIESQYKSNNSIKV